MSYHPAPHRPRRSTSAPRTTDSNTIAPTRSPSLRGIVALVGTTVLLSLALAACGSSTPASRPTSHPAQSPATTTTTAAPLPTAGSKSATAGALRATIVGQNHTPTVNQPWRYSLQVRTASGHPISGKVTIEFVFAGQVASYDRPPTHPITNGIWQSTLRFPKVAVGYPLNLRAVAHTKTGSITVDWPITVRQ